MTLILTWIESLHQTRGGTRRPGRARARRSRRAPRADSGRRWRYSVPPRRPGCAGPGDGAANATPGRPGCAPSRPAGRAYSRPTPAAGDPAGHRLQHRRGHIQAGTMRHSGLPGREDRPLARRSSPREPAPCSPTPAAISDDTNQAVEAGEKTSLIRVAVVAAAVVVGESVSR